MAYKILIKYQTGDSFSSEDTEDEISHEWEKLETAKKNLKRIEDHYLFIQKHKDGYQRPECGTMPEGCFWDEEYKHIGLELLLDDGPPKIEVYPFWCGCFERLYGAEIRPMDSDMAFEVGY